MLLDRADGLQVPVLPGGRVLIPQVSKSSAVYFVLDTGPEPRGGLTLRHGALGSDEWLEEVEFSLGEAWVTIPPEYGEEMTVVRRVWRTGGTPEARRAYRTAILPLFERSKSSWMTKLQADLRSPLALVDLDRDMQPLAYAEQVLALSHAAETGDIGAFRRLLLEIPLTLQLNPDIQALQDRAAYVTENTEEGSNPQLGQMHALLSEGRHAEALALGDKLLEHGDERARAVRCEAILGLAWLEMDSHAPHEILDRLEEEAVVEVLGQNHKGLSMLMEHLRAASK